MVGHLAGPGDSGRVRGELPEQVNAALADVHAGDSRNHFAVVVNEVQLLNPDAVFVGHDVSKIEHNSYQLLELS